MFSTIYLLKYNNYYNRLIKYEETITDYVNKGLVQFIQDKVNFNPNDGVVTELIVNTQNSHFDYLLEENNSTGELTRWFIINSERIRNGQYKLNLKRDVVADYYSVIINSPCFIEKATAKPGNPLIFNNENMNFNQIKTKEILLENNLKTPWVVAYLSRYSTATEEGSDDLAYNKFSGKFKNEGELTVDSEYASIEDYPLYALRNTVAGDLIYENQNFSFETAYKSLNDNYVQLAGVSQQGGVYGNTTETFDRLPEAATAITYSNPKSIFNSLNAIYSRYYSIDSFNLKKNTLSNWYSYDSFLKIKNENNKIIKAGSDVYQVTVYSYQTLDANAYQFVNPSTELWNKMKELLVDPYMNTTEKAPYFFLSSAGARLVKNVLTISIEPISQTVNEIEYNFEYTGSVTRDAEYEVIATPLYNVLFETGNEGQTFAHLGSYGLQWFQALANKYYSSNGCYDLQIVPYCPIDDINIAKEIADNRVIYCTEDEGRIKRAIAFRLTKSSFSFLKDNVQLELNPDIKIGTLTELYRLTSPNGVGNFDFNPYKNGGFSGYEIDCTLKPISPYIKINPIFNNGYLYGGDFNDFRGLICGGDFSLSITSNAWQTYANSNKYFQEVFDRQITNLETNNQFDIEARNWQIAAGIATSMTTGAATTGLLAGGNLGAAALGGVAGGVLSAQAGYLDYKMANQRFEEAIDYTKDNFGYTLQTIKARSDTLTKTTSYNINNKYFPYIEVFTCTEQEKEALKNKIKYNGMTIMIIDTISNYIQEEPSYIKGKLIRIENFHDDYHLLSAISNEINQGVFI